MKNTTNRREKASCAIQTWYLFSGWVHAILLILSVTVLDICVFVYNKFEDLFEIKLSKMIEKIKLQLICIIEHILLESSRAEMCRKQPLENKPFAHFEPRF